MILALVAFACADSDLETQFVTSEGITFGHFYGMCIGDRCVQVYKLTDGAVLRDTKKKYPTSESAYDGVYVQMDASAFEKVKSLRDAVPASLLTQPKIIGTPDAADGGGIYFEMKVNGERRFWFIDKMRPNVPSDLHPFLDQVEKAIADLN